MCRAPKGESRGAPPQWQESEGVPRAPKGESRGAPPQWQESEGVPRAPKGESRGAPPQWQEVWRMCLHKQTIFFILPPSSQEGG